MIFLWSLWQWYIRDTVSIIVHTLLPFDLFQYTPREGGRMKESAEEYRNWTIELLNKIDDIDIIKKVYKFLVYLYLK